jgi:hypothetical protein
MGESVYNNQSEGGRGLSIRISIKDIKKGRNFQGYYGIISSDILPVLIFCPEEGMV